MTQTTLNFWVEPVRRMEPEPKAGPGRPGTPGPGTQANARRGDPESSYRAALDVESSGTAQRQRDEVLAAVRAHPRLSSRQLAAAAGLDRYMVARRLPELRSAGLVESYMSASDGGMAWKVSH